MVYYIIKNHIYVCTYNVCTILKGSGKMKKLLIANLSVLVVLVLLTVYNMLGNSGMFYVKPSGSESETQPLYGAIKRDSMLDGKSIPFTVESKGVGHWNAINGLPKDLQVFIANSPYDLKIINSLAFGYQTTTYASEEKYNEEFFKENALIILTKTFGSSSYIMSVDSLVKKGNELSFNISISSPEGNAVNAAMMYVGHYIEVKKTYVIDNNKLSYFITEDTYSMY